MRGRGGVYRAGGFRVGDTGESRIGSMEWFQNVLLAVVASVSHVVEATRGYDRVGMIGMKNHF